MVWLKSLAGATLLSCLAISPLSARQGAPSANGLWLSDGYGLLLEVSDQSLQAYELTSISCIVSWSAKRDPGSTGREMVFTGDNVFRLSDGPSVDVRRLHLDGTTATFSSIEPRSVRKPATTLQRTTRRRTTPSSGRPLPSSMPFSICATSIGNRSTTNSVLG